MKLTHWQYIQATKRAGNCPLLSHGYCAWCGWTQDRDYPIQFVVEPETVGGIEIKPFDNTLKGGQSLR
jgi:hypothetical protein